MGASRNLWCAHSCSPRNSRLFFWSLSKNQTRVPELVSQIPNLGRVTPGAPESSFVCKCAEQAEVALGRFVDTRKQAVTDAWRNALRNDQSGHSDTFKH